MPILARTRVRIVARLGALALIVVSPRATAAVDEAHLNQWLSGLETGVKTAAQLKGTTAGQLGMKEKNAVWERRVTQARTDYLDYEAGCRAAEAQAWTVCSDANRKRARSALIKNVSTYLEWLSDKIVAASKPKTHPENSDLPLHELVERLDAQLDSPPTIVPQEFAEIFRDLERRQLLTKDYTKRFERTVGRSYDKNDASTVELAARIATAISDPKQRAQLKVQFDALGNRAISDAVARVAPNDEASFQLLLEALRAADAAVRAGAAGITQRFEPQFPASGNWLQVVFFDDQPPAGTLDIRRDFRQATKELLTAVTVNGIADPVLSQASDVGAELTRRACACAKNQTSGCGGVLGIQLREKDGGLVPVGRLIRNDKELAACSFCGGHASCSKFELTEPEAVAGSQPLGACADANECLFNAKKAAFVFLHRLRQKMNLFGVFSELPFWSDRKRTSVQVGPPLAADVGLSDLNMPIASKVPAELVSARGLRIEGACPGSFGEGLTNRLATTYDRVIGTLGTPDSDAPVLALRGLDPSGAAPPPRAKSDAPDAWAEQCDQVPAGASAEVCTVCLSYRKKPLYGVRATAKLADMRTAGESVARVIGQFYFDVENAHRAAAERERVVVSQVEFGPLPRPVPPFLHALALSGARQLEYSQWKRGWPWVAAESALLLSGVALTIASIVAENRSTPLDPQTDTANLYQGLSYASFGAVLPLRIVAGLTFSAEMP